MATNTHTASSDQEVLNLDTVRKTKYELGFTDPDAFYLLFLANGSKFQPVVLEKPCKYSDIIDMLKKHLGDNLKSDTHTVFFSSGHTYRIELVGDELDKKMDMPEPGIIEIFAK